MIKLFSDFIMSIPYETEVSPKWPLSYALEIKAFSDGLFMPAPFSQLSPLGAFYIHSKPQRG